MGDLNTFKMELHCPNCVRIQRAYCALRFDVALDRNNPSMKDKYTCHKCKKEVHMESDARSITLWYMEGNIRHSTRFPIEPPLTDVLGADVGGESSWVV